ncbi:hypothetical protein HAX54_017835 [Datura stramonium]|uniref:Non-specific lipid-transfer protein n=1 Tax=Datura stramonium TaxID=4076 RepID=A0ABS8S2Z3_DATST|nr:hypothetical protein [Datura stramonium]
MAHKPEVTYYADDQLRLPKKDSSLVIQKMIRLLLNSIILPSPTEKSSCLSQDVSPHLWASGCFFGTMHSHLTQGGEPGAACCSGVKSLKGLAQSTADKKVACNCVKAAANRYANLKDDAAQALPSKCGVTMDTPISRNVNCDASCLSQDVLTCGQVDASLAPCIPYLTQGGEPGAACCSGVKSLKGLAQSTADKKVACNCVKAAANRYANLKDDAAQALPSKCGVTMDTPISRNVNCDA